MIDEDVKKKLRVNLMLDRQEDVGENDDFFLTINDDTSDTVLLRIRIEPKAIADLISGRFSMEPCEAYYYPSDKIGRTNESKVIDINLNEFNPSLFVDFAKRREDKETVMLKAEKDNPGWEADRSHSICFRLDRSEGIYKVTLRRWVDKEEK